MVSQATVLIIGCGIAGPVLGSLLKRKGYRPIVFEKVSRLGDAGASLMLMPNGLKVLDLVDLVGATVSETRPLEGFHDATASGETLGTSDLPATFASRYGQPAAGVRRTSLNLALKRVLQEQDIDVREGWELTGVVEGDDTVTALFNGDRSVTGSFLIGCDGIKSATRTAILRLHGISEGHPIYTGLTQTAGISKAPKALLGSAELRNWYGNGIHVICYPVSASHISWAITQQEATKTEETWRLYRSEELPEQKKSLSDLLSGWDESILQLIEGAERITKYGLFDRGELAANHWYSRRCVLVGDAAHPTSPHLGQGANQALEDCFHLYDRLPTLDTSSATSMPTLELELSDAVFRPFAEKRQPRTAVLVKGARIQGTRRVVVGEEACRERDAMIRQNFRDSGALAERFDGLLREPFAGTIA